jgi:hypothetical protein
MEKMSEEEARAHERVANVIERAINANETCLARAPFRVRTAGKFGRLNIPYCNLPKGHEGKHHSVVWKRRWS